MVQVLHLMSTDAGLQSERTSALIRCAKDVAVTVRRIGRGGTYRNAAHAALSLRFGRGIPFDVIHAFDAQSLLAACAAPSPLIFSPTQGPMTVPAWWRGAMVYRNGTAIATSMALRHCLIRGGIPGPRCDFIPPTVDPHGSSIKPDETLRRALGISPGDHVVLAPGESDRAAGHLLALHAASIVHVLNQRVRLLIWGRGQQVKRVQRLAQLFRQPGVLIAVEPVLGQTVEFERLIGLADVALVASPQAVSMPTAMCMAAGLPIVSACCRGTEELLQDGRSASLAPAFAPRLLAQRLLQAMENPEEAREWANHARLQAARHFEPRQTVGKFLSLYERIAGVRPKGSAEEEHIEPALSK